VNCKCVYYNLSFYAVKAECERSNIILFWSEKIKNKSYIYNKNDQINNTDLPLYIFLDTYWTQWCQLSLFKCGTFQKLCIYYDRAKVVDFTTYYK
jgi:hypothetical protein